MLESIFRKQLGRRSSITNTYILPESSSHSCPLVCLLLRTKWVERIQIHPGRQGRCTREQQQLLLLLYEVSLDNPDIRTTIRSDLLRVGDICNTYDWTMVYFGTTYVQHVRTSLCRTPTVLFSEHRLVGWRSCFTARAYILASSDEM